ncbi:hypothetical protein [Thermogemmatispora sp.]|jgi:hypothetical protein|uniref:hypothetical protein n=1 Tax=Thermogemmatispora sp. TaxID=1968838 RepID=UPI0035E4153E
MEQEGLAVPYEDRQQVILGDGFEQALANLGWQLRSARSPYSDPQVLRQPWLRCPNGSHYRERQLYNFLLSTSCRQALRRLIERLPCPADLLVSEARGMLPNASFLQFLFDQQLLLRQEMLLRPGPGLAHLQDLGHTLEWLIAEWLRLYGVDHYDRLVPVRHGIRLSSPAIPGDIDVLAFLAEGPLLIECKSRTRTIEEAHFMRFISQVDLLRPFAAIFLIDIEGPLPAERVAQCARVLQRAGAAPLQGAGGFYCTAERIYLLNASLRFDERLATALEDARRRWRRGDRRHWAG